MNGKQVFQQLEGIATEQRNPSSMDIDARSTAEILTLINSEDKLVASAVEKELTYVEKAIAIVVNAFKGGGRLIYAGAGTSGRLGVLDAVECPPTFGTDPDMIQGIIAGGRESMFRAQEGVEDSIEGGEADIVGLKVTHADVVVGIAASLRTPYVMGAVRQAKKLGAKTIFITTNPREKLYSKEHSNLNQFIDVAICPSVGPEVIMGSTRMKSGTAQKMILNMITTTSMIQLGKIYENMMIDLQMTNEKLRERSKRIIMLITGIGYEEAEKYLQEAEGKVKTALVMIETGANKEDAKERLRLAGGFVRKAISGNY